MLNNKEFIHSLSNHIMTLKMNSEWIRNKIHDEDPLFKAIQKIMITLEEMESETKNFKQKLLQDIKNE